MPPPDSGRAGGPGLGLEGRTAVRYAAGCTRRAAAAAARIAQPPPPPPRRAGRPAGGRHQMLCRLVLVSTAVTLDLSARLTAPPRGYNSCTGGVPLREVCGRHRSARNAMEADVAACTVGDQGRRSARNSRAPKKYDPEVCAQYRAEGVRCSCPCTTICTATQRKSV